MCTLLIGLGSERLFSIHSRLAVDQAGCIDLVRFRKHFFQACYSRHSRRIARSSMRGLADVTPFHWRLTCGG